MAYKNEMELAAGPGIEWFAGQIDSPVMRLRFLRAATRGRQKRQVALVRIAFATAMLVTTAPPSLRVPHAVKTVSPAVAAPERPAAVYVAPASDIWLVENTDAGETYSNGLRIDNRFATSTHPRLYVAFPAGQPDGAGERRSVPAGIVYHTTESLQAPFEATENSRLQRIGESLLEYVKLRRSYNYVIDRFGRVYRVVRETDAANHAGHSVWSDGDWLYFNLNDSFLGVSFETQTTPGQEEATVTPAQIQSAAMLTDMLRRRYKIAAGNCVTHAQVSVNASSLRIGYHLDWASSFPFGQIGLPDNYAIPLPSVAVFGYEYDANFVRQAGDRMSRAAESGEQALRDRAAAANLDPAVYRRALQKKYRGRLSAVRDE